MTLLRFVGFHTGDLSECNSSSGSVGVTAYGDGYALRTNPTGSGQGWASVYGITSAGLVNQNLGQPVYYRFKLRVDTAPATGSEYLAFLAVTGGSNSPILRLDSNRRLNLYRDTNLVETGTTQLTLGVEYVIEGFFEAGASPDAYEVRIDGVTELSGTSTFAGSGQSFTGLFLGKASNQGNQDVDYYFRDVVIRNDTWPGVDLRTIMVLPTGNSAANTGWTASAGQKFECIDEIPPSATDYISSGTSAGDQRYSATHATAAALGIPSSILGVTVIARMQEASSTTTLGAVGIRSGSTNFELTAADLGDTTLVTRSALYENDPNTAAPWTQSGFNAAEPLVKRSTSDTSDIRCAGLYMVVLVPSAEEVEPAPFEIEWSGATPDVTLLAEAAIETEFQWKVGGRAQIETEFQWANGGRASIETEFLWQVAPSPLRIEYALTGRTGPVTYAFRFERRTKTNQFLQDVTPAITGASIDANNDRAIFRIGRMVIDATARDGRGNLISINPLSDHIAVFMDLTVDGNYVQALPMGLFALTVPADTYRPGEHVRDVVINDNCIHLLEDTTSGPYTVAAGENYLTGSGAVVDILNAAGLLHALPSTSLTLPVARTWPPGTPWLTVVNDLLNGANMYQLAFDANGVARTRARTEMTSRTPDVVYSGHDFVLIPVEEEAETTRLANRVIAVVDDPSRPPLSSVATNEDPDSPISTVTLGRTITKVIQADAAADQTTLDEIARNYLQREAGLYRRATLVTSIDPRREANEIYEITVDGVYAAERWWARNWAVELVIGAQMRHTLGKVERV